MATDQLQRPDFYEGQYLGAADLDAAVTYARLGHARHGLGAHTWGIAVGLGLREEPALAGGDAVDVFLQPGYAVDGFGRPIVVPIPFQLPAQLFSDELSGRVPVWLRYAEQTAGAPAFGFEVCETDDARSRIVEGYEVVVGNRSQAEQRDEISVAGVFADAVEVLHALDEDAPLLCDGSVPFQDFPDPADAQWLIPLGVVRWEAGPPGQLEATTEDDRRIGRAARRYLGVVAEGVHAADGVIRLRDRATAPPPEGTSAAAACAVHALRPNATDADLSYDEDADRVFPTELVWVEGHLRVVGDARLFGGKLEFRDGEGDDRDVPLWLRRTETNTFNEPAGPSGRDLQILLGRSDEGRNRLVVGQVTVAADGTDSVADRVIVQDDGRVGIGTASPTTPLARPLTIRGSGGDEGLVGFENATGTPTWHLGGLPGGVAGLGVVETAPDAPRLFLRPGGNVGVGTTAPEARLDVADVPTTSGGSPLTTDLWLRAGDGDDSGRFWVEYGSQGAPLLVLSDRDDPPRLQFQQTGNGDEAGPDYSSWIGHARSNAPDLAVMNANVGIGTTSPEALLHLVGGTDPTLKIQSDGVGEISGRLSLRQSNERGADIYYDGTSVEGLAIETFDGSGASSGVRVLIEQSTGRVGLGTTAPQERLDVRGNVKLGSAGDLFALGAPQNLRAVAGRVSSAGGVVSGAGFSAARTGEGAYTITFTSAFSATLVVLVTPVDATEDDNVASVRSLTQSSFLVRIKSVGDDDVYQDTAFTFLALGLRL